MISFAFVDFSDADDVKRSVALSETLLGGRKLLIKDARDYTGRPEQAVNPSHQTLSKSARRIADRQKNPPGPTLFLGNLGFEATVRQWSAVLCLI